MKNVPPRAAMVDPQQFRSGMQCLAAGVCVVATSDGTERSGFTATSVMSVSDQPPSLVIGIAKRNHAHALILRSGLFSVNVLGSAQDEVADTFAGRRGVSPGERFNAGHWSTSFRGCPILDDCLVIFECSVIDTMDLVTHTIAVGRVDHIEVPNAMAPLVYWRKSYAGVCHLKEPAG